MNKELEKLNEIANKLCSISVGLEETLRLNVEDQYPLLDKLFLSKFDTAVAEMLEVLGPVDPVSRAD